MTFYDTDSLEPERSFGLNYKLHSDIQYNKVCHITVQFQRFTYKIERHHFHMFEISGIDESTILEMIGFFLHSVILLT